MTGFTSEHRPHPARSGLLTAFIVAAVGSAAPASAQQVSKPGVVSVANATVALAVPANGASLRVDGRLDEEVWQSAPPITDFVQRDPDEGQPGTQRTEARVVYSDDALYVGVRAFDTQPELIAAHLTRRDEFSPSDWIGVMIDSYHDRRTAFEFSVNPAGVKIDIYRFDDNQSDPSWDAVWDVGTSRDSEGWTAEFRIPFSQLRFGNGEQHQFGFNVYRIINRRKEEQQWKLRPKSQSGFVSLFGDLAGIEGIRPPRRIEVMPYVSTTSAFLPSEAGNPFRTGSDQSAAVGADLNVGITSNLTLSATINPDFGQVEADPAVVNLSAFETFFPEKRPFFNEGIDIFRFEIDGQEQLFYTRRIGRTPQGEPDDRGGFAQQVRNTTILGATKLSGKTADGWTIGFAGALTAEERAHVTDSAGAQFQDPVEPRTTFLIGRMSKDFRQGKTQVGLFGTATNRSLPENLQALRSAAYTGGINWTHRFLKDGFGVNGYLVGSDVRGSPEAITETQLSSARYFQRPDNDYVTLDSTRTSLAGFAGQLAMEKRRGNWRGSTGITTRSPGFEINDLGFQRSADETSQWVWIQRRWDQPGKVFRRFALNFNQWSGYDYGWDKLYAGGNVNFNFTLPNYWGGYAGVNRNVEGLSTNVLRGGPAFRRPGGWNGWAGFESDDRKPLRGGIDGWWFRQDESDTYVWGISQTLSWRPASNMDFTVSPNYEKNHDTWQYLQTEDVLGSQHIVFGQLDQTTWSMTFRGSITFRPNLSLQLYAEPFVSTGDYLGYRQVADPRATRFAGRFDDFGPDRLIVVDGEVSVDLNRDGTADIELGNPDFTVLSFRSNLVLRWEYKLGSTLFLVWQHGRSDSTTRDRFRLGPSLGDIFRAQSENTFVMKVNYWLSL